MYILRIYLRGSRYLGTKRYLVFSTNNQSLADCCFSALDFRYHLGVSKSFFNRHYSVVITNNNEE